MSDDCANGSEEKNVGNRAFCRAPNTALLRKGSFNYHFPSFLQRFRTVISHATSSRTTPG